MTRKYGVYFPCDGQTIDTDLEDKDMEICGYINHTLVIVAVLKTTITWHHYSSLL